MRGLCRKLAQMDPRENERLPVAISFDEWLSHLFDHPVLPENWWVEGNDFGNLKKWDETVDPARTLSFLTQLFEHPES